MGALAESVRLKSMDDDATNLQPGKDSTTANLPIWSPEEEAELTRRQIASGPASAITENICTQDRSGALSAAEQRSLARIRKDRRNGFMVSAPDVDFLLEAIERLS